MVNAWDDMKKAKEESYFDKKNREALERLSKKKQEKPRPSPITGEPMEQIAINGVVVDRCPTSKGIWLDAGELEQLIETANKDQTKSTHWWKDFMKGITGN